MDIKDIDWANPIDRPMYMGAAFGVSEMNGLGQTGWVSTSYVTSA